MQLTDILKDSNHRLSQFKQTAIESLQAAIFEKDSKKGKVPYVECQIRGKAVKLTPEEVVRQLYLNQLLEHYNYPAERIQIEYGVKFGRETKRTDIVIFDKDRPEVPYIIIELKKPKLKDGKDQLKSYCNATGAPMGVWTNGEQISYYHRKDPNYFEDITDIPAVSQTLADILNEKFTWADLVKKDKLVNEKKSLRSLIEEMEDEVLANAGVDVFEEVFKLTFAKLYDEWLSGRDDHSKAHRLLEFRNTGQTETELKDKIQSLFNNAKDKWSGVFSEDSKIVLSPSHLSVCVAALENVKLFNSNLDVVDEAFEYLINQTSKGEKGQYFTPRYVIDMCVKMLNPQEHESLIDTAAGSSGFTVHGIFHVWEQIMRDEGLDVGHLFTVDRKPYRCTQYVEDKVFAIDFDEKAVRVSRTLNLIAGDGQTNVLHLNTLDYERWEEWYKNEDWIDTYNDGFKKLKKLCVGKGKQGYKHFNFDVLMANPPFAGDIKETRLLAKYDLGKKPNGKWQTKVGRDVLFIERNLDFLKPGGRMAVVLPQGRFNNSSDKAIRDFIAERCRILAVVGLHGNTFKPHTGTKTSVLFVQKWNDDPKAGALCPRVDDYNIFFATMRKSGKDNSGDKIYRPMLDKHGHLMVEHDLFNHDGLTEDGIAEAFIEFAKKEGLSFFEQSPSVKAFDAEKYRGLMDGLECAEVAFSKIDLGDRFDAEYFWKDSLHIQTVLEQKGAIEFRKFGDFVASAFYPAATHLYEDGDTPFIRCVDCINYPFITEEQNDSFENIPFSFIQEQSGINLLKKGDFVITKVGTPCYSSIVKEHNVVALSRTVLGVKNIKNINPYFLLAFLRSHHGFGQLLRQRELTIQYQLTLERVKRIKIYQPSIEFQEKIEKTILRFLELNLKSKQLYQQAETHLLEALGLKDWQASDDNTSIKRFSDSFATSGRLDAEFYQPKYENIEQELLNYEYGYQLLGNICPTPTNGVEVRQYIDDGVPYLRVGDVKQLDIDKNSVVYVDPESAQKNIDKVKLNEGDVLLSRSGSLGVVAVVEKNWTSALISSHLIRLQVQDKTINPYYLAFFLSSKIGKSQIEKRSNGGVQPEINQPALKSIVIPRLPSVHQNKIFEDIKQSRLMREQSQTLLTQAKTAVEKAIETNEAEASAWLMENVGWA